MKTALVISVVGHAAILALSGLSLPSPERLDVEDMASVDVEVIDMGTFVAISTPAPQPLPVPDAPVMQDMPSFEPPVRENQPDPEPRQDTPIAAPEEQEPQEFNEPVDQIAVESVFVPDETVADQSDAPEFVFLPPVEPAEAAMDLSAVPPGDSLRLPDADRVAGDIAPKPPSDVQLGEEDLRLTSPAEDADMVFSPPEVQDVARRESTVMIVTEAILGETPSSPGDMTPPERPRNALALMVPPTRPPMSAKPAAVENPDIDAMMSKLVSEDTADESTSEQAASAKEVTPQRSSGLYRSRLVRSIQNAWNVGALSAEAEQVVLEVRLVFNPDGNLLSAELKSATGGSNDAQRVAFEAAQRAIIQALGEGYDLPPDLYDEWREIIMIFDRNN
ncbi:MAG: hypothetical protein OXB95_10700 [Rhodobacteraceae bacterium]|nr:hypothetical protein [Paracoccaceae bacterium]